ncbi:MAG: 2-amino-4-hydroxy-6-hydroxymethyldihydropteridine diphosphokinase [Oxalobacter sp.]|nr:2-amino-4-hydroxy-6-hydroxymethyldihydropteridine diphosphokinase [Oxalobacter sp.]
MLDNTAYIGLGANLGNALQQVRAAVDILDHLDPIQIDSVSSLYRTAPIDSSGDDYINAVARLSTSLDADQLLDVLLQVERDFGRKRPYYNAPRTLDLDLLLFNDEQRTTHCLTLPHPRMHERAFVLFPLTEISPDIVIPGKGYAKGFLDLVSSQQILRLQPFSP